MKKNQSRHARSPFRFGARFGLLLLSSLAAVAAFAQQAPPVADSSGSDFVLQGVVRGSQNQSYVQVPFAVPDGTERVTITFSYTEKEQHTALDLGLLDPAGLRCWSGGNKSTLTVGLMDATPSCLPGAIPSGTWNVLIGVPNIRAGVESHYTIHVYLSRTGAVAALPPILREPLRAGPAWFRGDLHMHTAHSDGQCPSQTGKMVPCPLFFTVDAAARRGLDFIAITDHNASSQYDAMRELQPYFDKLLLIPGREITTFQGHINFLGSTDFVDFRLDGHTVPDVNTLLRSAARGRRHHIDQPPSGSERRNLPRLRMDAFHAGRHAFAHRRRGCERRQRAAAGSPTFPSGIGSSIADAVSRESAAAIITAPCNPSIKSAPSAARRPLCMQRISRRPRFSTASAPDMSSSM